MSAGSAAHDAHDAVEVIVAKRDGGTLSDSQIDWVLAAYTRGEVADEQEPRRARGRRERRLGLGDRDDVADAVAHRPLGHQSHVVHDDVEGQLAGLERAHGVVAALELPGHHEADPLVGDAGALEAVEAVEDQPDEVVRQRFAAPDGRLELGCAGAHPSRLSVVHQSGRIGKSDRPSA